jgi:hypothetical protein
MTGKDTIYLDVDDEITSIVHKVQSSPKSIVALVLPKRASTLQSIVNMKLLKRTATQNKKKVVLITSEAGLLPLAGAAGLHVAPNLTSKPVLPPSPNFAVPKVETVAEGDDVAFDPATPIGSFMPKEDAEDEAIEIDNEKLAPAGAAGGAVAASKSGKKSPKLGKDGKKLSVPNFERFRKWILLGGVAFVLLLIGLYWAFAIAPKATVTLKTEASEKPVTVALTADSTATEVNTEKNIVPANKEKLTKTDVEKVAASGQKDNGTKASGTIALKNCGKGSPAVTIPAGTGVSSGSYTFITQKSVSLDSPNFDGSGNCKDKGSHTGSVDVVAQKNGDAYNLAPQTYTVANYSGVIAQGSQMTGGTSVVVKVVSATDVEDAKTKIAAKQAGYSDELRQKLTGEGYTALTDSFNAGTPVFTVTPDVGTEADQVTVQAVTDFTMFGVKPDDLKKLIQEAIKHDIDTSKQSILNEGLSDAVFHTNGDKTAAKLPLSMQANVVIGPQLDQNEIKQEIAGKKRGEAESILKSRPGVNDVQAVTHPAWASKIPKKQAKITVVIQQADGTNVDTQQP